MTNVTIVNESAKMAFEALSSPSVMIAVGKTGNIPAADAGVLAVVNAGENEPASNS
jgi:hypothetical protein